MTPGDANLRSEFEAGPARVRQRFTSVVPTFAFSITMTVNEFEIFKSFYNFTLGNGSAWFFVNLWSGQMYSEHQARFVEHWKMQDFSYNHVRVTFSLEARNLHVLSDASSRLLSNFTYEFICDELKNPLEFSVNNSWPATTRSYQ